MAENKKSFLLYCDLIHTVRKMPKEKAGELFMHILSYVNDENPVTDDLLIDLTFEQIKQQLKRDLMKYDAIRLRNKENAEKRWNATASDRIPPHTKNADIDNDTVNDTDTDNDKEKEDLKKSLRESRFAEFWDLYGKKVDFSKCKAKFLKLSEADVNKILSVVKCYVKSTPEVRYRKNPLTWLNGKCWDDEINPSEMEVYECTYVGAFGKAQHRHAPNQIDDFLAANKHMKLSTKTPLGQA